MLNVSTSTMANISGESETVLYPLSLSLTRTLTLTRTLPALILNITPTLEHACDDVDDVFHWVRRIVDPPMVHDVRLSFVIDRKGAVG